jgi:hypothetical protein
LRSVCKKDDALSLTFESAVKTLHKIGYRQARNSEWFHIRGE